MERRGTGSFVWPSEYVQRMEHVVGSGSLHRLGYVRFPNHAFRDDDAGLNVALLGREGFLRVYFGRGRRVELADGTRWRIQATESGQQIAPVVTSSTGKLAMASLMGRRSYGIHGSDFAMTFFPVPGSDHRGSHWSLWDTDQELATFGGQTIVAATPIPLAAALLCFTLQRYGIPGESKLLPAPSSW